jgi:hypothetical protein
MYQYSLFYSLDNQFQWSSPWIPQYKCPQYGKISNLILVRLNITHAIYVLNFLHVERWHIFEVFNHIYNVNIAITTDYLFGIFKLFLSRCHCFTEMKRCNHIYNVIFKYNVIYYIGRIIKTKCLLQIEQPMMCTKTPEKVRVVLCNVRCRTCNTKYNDINTRLVLCILF